ncbi:MAG: hypothetical protein Q4A17_13965 [Thermoguttaceae bacterium]|nr:hypothetical protein [Thermoguttaceae bacterium]
MKTSAFLVSALLIFTLVLDVSAQTNNDAKPDEMVSCPYKVVENDNVYVQISKVRLRSNNLPLYPYFSLYGMIAGEWKRITTTYSQEGNQICEEVPKPANFQFYINKECKECFVNVYSKWHTEDQLVSRGVKFETKKLFDWANDSQTNDETYSLDISKGNTIYLKKGERKDDRYYFQIVSYKITSINNDYRKYLYESYKSWMITRLEGASDKWLYFDNKKFIPAAKDTLDFAELSLEKYDKSEREFLLPCKANEKVTFTFANRMGTLDTIELSTEEVIKQFNACMQNFPDDHTKWVVKCTSRNQSEIELSFAGIRRIYRVTTVAIPVTHSIRQKPRYSEKGYAPIMRIYIQQDGLSCCVNGKYARSSIRSWDCDIPNDRLNRFEIREGVNANFALQIKDKDTKFYEIDLVGISEIKDLDFSKKVVYEKLGSDIDEDKRTKVKFEEVKD